MKKLLAYVVIMVMAFSLAGCAAKNKSEETPAATEATTEAVTQAAKVETEAQTKPAAEEPTKAADNEGEFELNPELLHLTIKDTHEGGQGDDNRMVYTLSFPQVTLSKEEAAKYPELDTAIREDLNNNFSLTAEDGRTMLSDYYSEEELASEYYMEHTYKITAEVARADSNIFSVKEHYDTYFGGAHPDGGVHCYSYNTKTGKLITPADVFTSKEDLTKVLKEKLSKIEYVEYFDLDKDIDSYEFESSYMAEKFAFNMLLTNDAVVFYFNPYEIAPYAAGQQIVVLPYDEYASIMKPGIGNVAKNHVSPLDEYTDYSCREGKIKVQGMYSDYGDVRTIAITVNDTEYDFETQTYKFKPMLAECDDDTYLLVFESGDDDTEYIDVFEIDDGKAEKEGRINQGIYDENEEGQVVKLLGLNCYARTSTYDAFTDPMKLKLRDGRTISIDDID